MNCNPYNLVHRYWPAAYEPPIRLTTRIERY